MYVYIEIYILGKVDIYNIYIYIYIYILEKVCIYRYIDI
jgi:hypothetical protein